MKSVFRFPKGEFHPNIGLNADMRREGLLDNELARLADLAALGAREIAVRVAFDTGDYFSSIHSGLGKNRRGLTVGRVSADDFKAHWIEKGYRTIRGEGIKSSDRGRRTQIRNLGGEQLTGLGFVKGKRVLARGARKAGLKVRQSKHRRPE